MNNESSHQKEKLKVCFKLVQTVEPLLKMQWSIWIRLVEVMEVQTMFKTGRKTMFAASKLNNDFRMLSPLIRALLL